MRIRWSRPSRKITKQSVKFFSGASLNVLATFCLEGAVSRDLGDDLEHRQENLTVPSLAIGDEQASAHPKIPRRGGLETQSGDEIGRCGDGRFAGPRLPRHLGRCHPQPGAFQMKDRAIRRLDQVAGVDVDDAIDPDPLIVAAAGEDGLILAKRILATAAERLSEEGVLVVEVGNSYVHLQQQFPDVPFTWVEFEQGGHGVFVITKAQLDAYGEQFAAYRS